MGTYIQDSIERVVCNGMYFNMEGELKGLLTRKDLRSLRRSWVGLDAHLYGLDMIAREREEWDIWERTGEMLYNKEWRERNFTYSFLLALAMLEVED